MGMIARFGNWLDSRFPAKFVVLKTDWDALNADVLSVSEKATTDLKAKFSEVQDLILRLENLEKRLTQNELSVEKDVKDRLTKIELYTGFNRAGRGASKGDASFWGSLDKPKG